MNRRVLIIGMMLAGLLALAWWGQHGTPEGAAPSPSSTSSTPSAAYASYGALVPAKPSASVASVAPTTSAASVAITSTSSRPPGAGVAPDDDPQRSTGPIDPYIQALVQAQAVTFMQAYARPPTSGEQYWWGSVLTFLAPSAVDTVRKVDPASVPFTTVDVGRAQVDQQPDPHGNFQVAVPTNAGTWTVTLTPAADARYLVLSVAQDRS